MIEENNFFTKGKNITSINNLDEVKDQVSCEVISIFEMIKSYNKLIRDNCNSLEDVKYLFTVLRINNLLVNEVTITTVINKCCSNLGEVREVFNIEDLDGKKIFQDVKPNEVTITTVINRCCNTE